MSQKPHLYVSQCNLLGDFHSNDDVLSIFKEALGIIRQNLDINNSYSSSSPVAAAAPRARAAPYRD